MRTRRDEREESGGADWGMKRKEVNNRREMGRRGRRKGKTTEDDRKIGNLSINYYSMATRDNHMNSMQGRITVI